MKTAIISITDSSPSHADWPASQVELDLFREAVLHDLGIAVSHTGSFVMDSGLLNGYRLDEVSQSLAAGLISGEFEVWYEAAMAMIKEYPVRIEYQLNAYGEVDGCSRCFNDGDAATHTIELSSDFMRGVFTEIRSPLPAEPIKLEDYQAVLEVVEASPGTTWGSPEFRDALDAHHRALRVEQMHAAIGHVPGKTKTQSPAQLASPRRRGAGL